MSGFVDIHHHILYGIDDGPKTFEEMALMLIAAKRDGVEYIVATPHTTPGLTSLDESLIKTRLSEARQYCKEKGLNVKIILGSEILVTPFLVNLVLEGSVPTVEGTQCVLAEFMPNVRYADMMRGVKQLLRGGYTVILAHMERYHCLRNRYTRVMSMKEKYGVLMQMDCSAIVHAKGYLLNRYVKKLLDRRLIDYVASDAHNVTYRKTKMKLTYDILKRDIGDEYATKLMKGGLDIFTDSYILDTRA